jgi:hypothetical protein
VGHSFANRLPAQPLTRIIGFGFGYDEDAWRRIFEFFVEHLAPEPAPPGEITGVRPMKPHQGSADVISGFAGLDLSRIRARVMRWSPTPVLAPGTGPGAGRIDVPFGVAPEVFLLEERGAATVFTQRIRCAVQESTVAGRVEMLQLTKQICLGKILGGHTWHVVLL